MLIPKIRVRIISTTQEFDSSFERAMWIRDNEEAAERVFTFYYVNKCTITQSFNLTADTCTIVIPRNLKFTEKPITKGNNEITTDAAPQVDSKEKEVGFAVGDVIEVYMTLEWSDGGQYDSYGEKLRYKGYIKAITPNDNLVIQCEDDMWLLKQRKLQKAYPKGAVIDMVKDMVKGIMPAENVRGGNIGQDSEAKFIASGYRLKRNPTIAKALIGLRTNFKMRAWFKNRELWIGKLWYEDQAEEEGAKNFEFQRNIISDNLQYQKKEDYLRGVEVEVINSTDNSRFKVFAGTDDGDVERIPAVDLTKADAQAMADNHLKRITYDGFRGSFKIHIEPYLEHGWYVNLHDPRFGEERNGKYVIEKVVTSYDYNGAFQNVYLSSKVKES